MVRTNKANLLEVALIGEVTHSAVAPTYTTGWDQRPLLGLGRGGIVYNVKVGDQCFGWAWGEKVEPGVSADGVGNDNEKGAFRNLSCIGNRVRVTEGEAKGDWGTVIGKVGYLPGRGHHVSMHFGEETLEKLAIGDKVQIKANGAGLKLLDYPGVRVISCSSTLLEAWGLGESGGKLIVPVTKVVPAKYVGQGHGGSPPEANNWDIQTQSPDAISHVEGLRFGDMVILEDILSSWGRGYYEGAVTVGVISCGPTKALGQGIGVTTLLTCKEGEIEAKVEPDANLKALLGIGGENR
ncbi:MAG: DUF4438 domain-containing protein [Candidatus Bathyarchaeota archaeon]|jgi:hypothetical protein|nr:DUF4438 domain-containing protein [Candidatus Bathyarchaeota archaeon]